MEILTAYCSDVGNVKQVNQDALLIQTARLGDTEIGLFIICDGMGGLSMGERASAHVIQRFLRWFEQELPAILDAEEKEEIICEQWVKLLDSANVALAEFGVKNRIQLGTTCTAMLILEGEYYAIHVGDTRIYEITDEIRQFTQDQTVLAREIAMGRVAKENAKHDARGSVLLQCVGASASIDPQFLKGEIKKDAVYMLCSDGFRHEVTEDEFLRGFAPESMTDEKNMERQCRYFVQLNKTREERDNITVILIKMKND